MIFAFWALDRFISDAGKRSILWVAASGWAAASAFATRPTNVFFTLPFCIFALWIFRRRGKEALAFLAGIAPVAAWYIGYNIIYFGAPWISGHNYNMAVRRIPGLLHIRNFPAGFLGLLFSPSLGLVFTAPQMLFALPGLVSVIRPRLGAVDSGEGCVRIQNRCASRFRFSLLRLAAVFVVLHILFYSCYLEWWGGYSFAHRYLIDIQPFLALLIAWFFRPGARWRSIRWPLFLPAMLFGIAVQFYGAFIWSGVPFYSQMPENKRLYLNFDPARGHAAPFNHPSFFFSWDPDDHMVLLELDSIRNKLTDADRFSDMFLTWDKVHRDLFEAKYVDFSVSPPILLQFGKSPPGDKL